MERILLPGALVLDVPEFHTKVVYEDLQRIESDNGPYWRFNLEDRQVEWRAGTGPLFLTKEELAQVAFDQLSIEGSSWEEVQSSVDLLAGAMFKPYILGEDTDIFSALDPQDPFIIAHSATPVNSNGFVELEAAMKGAPECFDVYTSLRAGSTIRSGKGDIMLGRGINTAVGELPDGSFGVEIGNQDYYYSTEAAIKWLLDDPYFQDEINPLTSVVTLLSEYKVQGREPILNLYAVDTQAKVLWLSLLKKAGYDTIRVDGNSSEAADLNRKDVLYADVNDLMALDRAESDFSSQEGIIESVKKEKKLTDLYKRFGEEILDVSVGMPGCSIRAKDTTGEIQKDVEKAKEYFDLYGITHVVVKLTNASSGEGIWVNLDITDEDGLSQITEIITTQGKDVVIEPMLEYDEFAFNGDTKKSTMSFHGFGGRAVEGFGSVQSYRDGTTIWNGNTLLSKDHADRLKVGKAFSMGLSFVKVMAQRSHEIGLSVWGVDTFSGKVKSNNPIVRDMTFMGVQDMNIRTPGAKFMYIAWMKTLQEIAMYTGRELREAAEDVSIATEIYTPWLDHDGTQQALRNLNGSSRSTKIIASIPGLWGMLAGAAEKPEEALKNVKSSIKRLQR